jgi:hypothetical protein
MQKRLSIFERKILGRTCGPICEGGQWRKMYNRELEELYNEPSIVKVIKFSRLRWADHVVRMDEKSYVKRYCGQTLEVTEDVADRNQDGLAGWRKTQGKWDVEIGGRMPRMQDAGDICLRRQRTTQGCRADGDDNDDYDETKRI